MDRSTFVAEKAGELTYLPPYFRRMEELNRAGPPAPPERWLLRSLGASELAGMQVVDIRSPTAFGAGHVPGSLSIWRAGLTAFMGWVLDYDRPIALVDDFNLDLDGVAADFVRLGYDNLAGYLGGGFVSWFRSGRPVGRLPIWSVHDLPRAPRRGHGPRRPGRQPPRRAGGDPRVAPHLHRRTRVPAR